jgi:hypothetical protein
MTARDIVLDEVEFMLDAGEAPASIAARLGLKPGSVARALYRVNRPDVAILFEAARRATEGGRCVDCEAPVARRQSSRCRPCGYVQRERTKRQETAA